MEAYKFKTTIQENGVIRIPEIADLAHQQVEIFVVINLTSEVEAYDDQVIDRFLNRWRGVLKDAAPEDLKARYLQEKYG